MKKVDIYETYNKDGTGRVFQTPNPAWHEGNHDWVMANDKKRPARWVGVLCILAIGVIVSACFAAGILVLNFLEWFVNLL